MANSAGEPRVSGLARPGSRFSATLSAGARHRLALLTASLLLAVAVGPQVYRASLPAAPRGHPTIGTLRPLPALAMPAAVDADDDGLPDAAPLAAVLLLLLLPAVRLLVVAPLHRRLPDRRVAPLSPPPR